MIVIAAASELSNPCEMSVGETIGSWSVMETILCVVGIVCVPLLNVLV